MAAGTELARRATSEAVGTALLLATVVGSGIMAERLSGGNAGLALLANALATGAGLGAAELVATFRLLAVIWGCSRRRTQAVPFAVAAYIVAAYWFTGSTSFANPAVTLARSATDTFAGIRPADTPGFIMAQLVGATLATLLFRWLTPALPDSAREVVVPHPENTLLPYRPFQDDRPSAGPRRLSAVRAPETRSPGHLAATGASDGCGGPQHGVQQSSRPVFRGVQARARTCPLCCSGGAPGPDRTARANRGHVERGAGDAHARRDVVGLRVA
jgi:hypothetical protein